MGKKRRVILTALLVTVLGGLVWAVLRSGLREPIYEGKTVSYWLRDTARGKPPDMDSNAVPFLIKALQTRDGALRRIYANAWARMPHWLQNRSPKPAEAVMVRYNAAFTLYGLGGDAKPAIPALIRSLRGDEDKWVRYRAAIALRNIDNCDNRVIEALVEALKQPEPAVRSEAAVGLGNIGKNDKKVTDALVEASKDNDLAVRFHAGEALQNIDPAAAAKAGVK